MSPKLLPCPPLSTADLLLAAADSVGGSHHFPGLDVVTHIFPDIGAFPSVPEENSQLHMQLVLFFFYVQAGHAPLYPYGLTTYFGQSDSRVEVVTG